MKMLIMILGLSLGVQAQTFFNPKVTEVAINDVVVKLRVNLNKDTVICDFKNFSSIVLTLIIPEIANYSDLTHQNYSSNTTLPELSAGDCDQAISMSDSRRDSLVLAGAEDIDLRIRRFHVFTDFGHGTCDHSYAEELTTTIHGIDFSDTQSINITAPGINNCP